MSDYGRIPDDGNHFISLKIETGGPTDYFLGFNRKSGVNSETQQYPDLVTIYRVGSGDGRGYSQSMLKGALQQGRTATVSDWRDTGIALVIKVNEINTKSSPAYAEVEVLFGDQTEAREASTPPPTTSKPTLNPTQNPTPKPTNVSPR